MLGRAVKTEFHQELSGRIVRTAIRRGEDCHEGVEQEVRWVGRKEVLWWGGAAFSLSLSACPLWYQPHPLVSNTLHTLTLCSSVHRRETFITPAVFITVYEYWDCDSGTHGYTNSHKTTRLSGIMLLQLRLYLTFKETASRDQDGWKVVQRKGLNRGKGLWWFQTFSTKFCIFMFYFWNSSEVLEKICPFGCYWVHLHAIVSIGKDV